MRYQIFKAGDESISFKEYVDRRKEGQDAIYYITGKRIADVPSFPFLEALRKKILSMNTPSSSSRSSMARNWSRAPRRAFLSMMTARKKLEECKAEFELLTKLM